MLYNMKELAILCDYCRMLWCEYEYWLEKVVLLEIQRQDSHPIFQQSSDILPVMVITVTVINTCCHFVSHTHTLLHVTSHYLCTCHQSLPVHRSLVTTFAHVTSHYLCTSLVTTCAHVTSQYLCTCHQSTCAHVTVCACHYICTCHYLCKCYYLCTCHCLSTSLPVHVTTFTHVRRYLCTCSAQWIVHVPPHTCRLEQSHSCVILQHIVNCKGNFLSQIMHLNRLCNQSGFA